MASTRQKSETDLWVEELRKEYRGTERFVIAVILIGFAITLTVGLLIGLLS